MALMKLTKEEKKELIQTLHMYENHDYPVLRTFYKPDMEFDDTISEIHLEEVLQQIHQDQKLRELIDDIDVEKLIKILHKADMDTPVVKNSRTFFVETHYKLRDIQGLLEENKK